MTAPRRLSVSCATARRSGARQESPAARIVEVGSELRDRDGAEVLILGCASMGAYRPEIERRLGLPVIDPTQAAAMRAIGLISLGYRRAG